MAIIKKGTYRFNDVLSVIPYDVFKKSANSTERRQILAEHGLDITPVSLTLEGISVTITRISLANAFGDMYTDGEPTVFYEEIVVNIDVSGQSVEAGFDAYKAASQTVTIPKDSEVSAEFAVWFAENTKRIIKAGTYRFNDVLERIRVARSLNFYIPFSFALNDNGSIIKEDTPLYCVAFDWKTFDVLRYVTVEGESILAYGETDSGFAWDVMWAIASDGLGTDAPDFLKGYGQTIIIPEDAEVDEAFAAWFAENTKRKQFTKLNIGDVAYSSGGKCFKRLTTEQPTTLAAGLYDADDNLVAFWDTLVNAYGMDCEKNYTSSSYMTDKASPYYVLTKYSWLANGVKLIIGSDITNIGDYAFFNCTGLTSVVIGDSVTRIGKSAFDSCFDLTEVVMPTSVENICIRAFGYIAIDLKYRGTEEQWNAITKEVYWDSNASVTITYNYTMDQPEEPPTDEPTEEFVPFTVTADNRTMIGYTGSTTKLVIPETFQDYDGTNYRVVAIYDGAFYGCTNLTSAVIPNGVKSIGYEAFRNCAGLSSIVIPDSVTSIGKWAFLACINLKSIKYRGTEERWNAISKGDDWDKETYNYTITYNYTGE